jgi:DNA-binding NarL/FixJ family response regulator
MTMADRSMAVLPLHNPADVESRLVVYDPLLLEALALLFELYWQTALPLHVRHGEPQLSDACGGPSVEEAHLLPLLMAGLNDQEIGAQLNLSARTVRHRVQQMMIRLDAINRFQAGYQAVARGWLAAGDVPLAEPA